MKKTIYNVSNEKNKKYTLTQSSLLFHLFCLLGIFLPFATNGIAQTGLQNNTNDNSILGTEDNQPLRFITNSQERMRLTPSGKLGIGVSNPLKMLEVN